MIQTAFLHRHACVRVSAAQLSKRLGSLWNCVWGHALERSLGINRKGKVLCPGPRFLSSATWPLLPKKQYNGLITNTADWFMLCHCSFDTFLYLLEILDYQ